MQIKKYLKAMLKLLPLVLICSFSSLFAANPPEVALSSSGNTSLQIVVGKSASEQIRTAAKTLAEYLQQMSGAKFAVSTGDGKTGIALGIVGDFPNLKLDTDFDTKDPQHRDDYLLRTHDNGIYMIGSSEVGAENAVWDLLYRLGYRHYFPSKNWEIIPKNPNLKISIDTFEQPDYTFRRIWYGYGTWSENVIDTDLWRTHNRMQTAFKLNNTHTYSTIIAAYPDEFAKHPEYLSHVNGKPTNKLNVANADLRKLVVKWALEKMEGAPEVEVLPLDPSDGGGWGQSKEEMELGPISNRVVLLANEVAEAINAKFAEKYGKKYVGIYAYNEHATPPTIKVNPNVMVLVATAFNKSGLSLEKLISGWQEQGANVGIREYYNVITGSGDLPGKPGAANIEAISINISKYHKLGAKFISAESCDSWGPCGLGHYLASRFTWNTKEGNKLSELQEDFLEKSFGEAKEPMRRFYKLLIPPTMRSENSLGQMYRAIDEAQKLTRDPAILSRIRDLLIYTRYVDIRMQYASMQKPSADDKMKAFENMVRFLYRARNSHMVHLQGLWRDMPKRDKDLAINGTSRPKETAFNTPEGINPWKSSEPITDKELSEWLKDGIARNKIIDIEPIVFSHALEPATVLHIKDKTRLETSNFIRKNIFYTWVAPEQKEIHLCATVQVKANPKSSMIFLQNAKIAEKIQSATESLEGFVDDQAGEADATSAQMETDAEDMVEIKPLEGPQKIVLKPKGTGLYRIVLNSGAKYGINIEWDEKTILTHESTMENRVNILAGFTRYFYVPKKTVFVAGFVDASGTILDADGKEVFRAIKKMGAYFKIPVEKGQDGKLWTIKGTYIKPVLLTVPPYLFRSANDIMLPKEVIDADKTNHDK